MLDGRQPTLEAQAVGAIHGHAQGIRTASAKELERLAAFERTEAFFSSPRSSNSPARRSRRSRPWGTRSRSGRSGDSSGRRGLRRFQARGVRRVPQRPDAERDQRLRAACLRRAEGHQVSDDRSVGTERSAEPGARLRLHQRGRVEDTRRAPRSGTRPDHRRRARGRSHGHERQRVQDADAWVSTQRRRTFTTTRRRRSRTSRRTTTCSSVSPATRRPWPAAAAARATPQDQADIVAYMKLLK